MGKRKALVRTGAFFFSRDACGAAAPCGAFDRLETSGGARKKIITFVPAVAGTGGTANGAFPDAWQSHFSTTTHSDDGKFTISVAGHNVVTVSQEILSTAPSPTSRSRT